MSGEGAQQGAQILAPAFAEEGEKDVELARRERRGGGQPRVVAILARQHREHNSSFARQHREPLDAVAPPVETAEQAHQDYLGILADPFDPQIDRHGMAQIA